ncbi:hypothetical protein J437_LFUL017912 [Ladona fulva]|uniref:PiggyBac transposable element-derived protein domain-containing protein n=1 Tax=Ladona fulva TaxID=123851 RepID=A0A8K0KLD7_LADFU|nr:hypothetical protein J437_LFUL017912 [Ladona fulva]
MDYWYNPDIECSIVKNCMTFRRFKKLTKYLHISDIEEEKLTTVEGYDVLQKVRPVLDIIDNFHEKYRPGRELVVDEAMVAFKGRHHIKQYIKNKPTKWGFKVWVLATPQGYVLRGNVYLGKKKLEIRECFFGVRLL